MAEYVTKIFDEDFELIRCKNCIHRIAAKDALYCTRSYNPQWRPNDSYDGYSYVNRFTEVTPEGFCAWGEKTLKGLSRGK